MVPSKRLYCPFEGIPSLILPLLMNPLPVVDADQQHQEEKPSHKKRKYRALAEGHIYRKNDCAKRNSGKYRNRNHHRLYPCSCHVVTPDSMYMPSMPLIRVLRFLNRGSAWLPSGSFCSRSSPGNACCHGPTRGNNMHRKLACVGMATEREDGSPDVLKRKVGTAGKTSAVPICHFILHRR